jgi:hypothetical protein
MDFKPATKLSAPTFDEAIAETGRMPIQHQGFDDQNEDDQRENDLVLVSDNSFHSCNHLFSANISRHNEHA